MSNPEQKPNLYWFKESTLHEYARVSIETGISVGATNPMLISMEDLDIALQWRLSVEKLYRDSRVTLNPERKPNRYPQPGSLVEGYATRKEKVTTAGFAMGVFIITLDRLSDQEKQNQKREISRLSLSLNDLLQGGPHHV